MTDAVLERVRKLIEAYEANKFSYATISLDSLRNLFILAEQAGRMRGCLQEIAELDKHGGYNTACHRARAALQERQP